MKPEQASGEGTSLAEEMRGYMQVMRSPRRGTDLREKLYTGVDCRVFWKSSRVANRLIDGPWRIVESFPTVLHRCANNIFLRRFR